MNGVQCPNCKHVYEGDAGLWGKICLKCGHYILPSKDNGLRSAEQKTKQQAKKYLRNYLRKQQLGDSNANQQ